MQKRSFLHRLRWPLRVMAVFGSFLGLLVLLMFNPSWMYAHATEIRGWTVLHDQPLPPALTERIADAQTLLETSELADSSWKITLALNDGSFYPSLPRAIFGDAFGWGFKDQVVIGSALDASNDRAEIRGVGYNLTRLLAHEGVHSLQFHDLGLFHSRPWADIPDWKWEGYAEYVSHSTPDRGSLFNQIQSLDSALRTEHHGWYQENADVGVPMHYAQFHVLVRYCMEVEGLSWHALLADERDAHMITTAVTRWFQRQSGNQLF